jgi:hypothetical protein
VPKKNCHPDKKVTNSEPSEGSGVLQTRPGNVFERTRITCHAVLDKAACAPLLHGKAHEVRPQEIQGAPAPFSASAEKILHLPEQAARSGLVLNVHGLAELAQQLALRF